MKINPVSRICDRPHTKNKPKEVGITVKGTQSKESFDAMVAWLFEEEGFKIGDKVTYVHPTGYSYPEKGIVSGYSSYNGGGINVFVVYNCNNDWENYMKYTGASTPVKYLVRGWRDG